MPNAPPVLKLEQLNKTYGQRVAVQDLNLTIAPGEVYGLLGPNGAGKTTTINLICNLLQPDSGSIRLNDQPVSAKTTYLIGVAPQETLLYCSLTCAENLQFFANLYGLHGARQRQRVQACLAEVGLADQADQLAETLSGGMQRRLSLAIALVHQPKLVILDEPTTGLDLEARYEIWNLIRSLQRQGSTILLTTHLLDEAERLCHQIGILKQGRLLAQGTLAELRGYVPAQEILLVQTPQEERAIARAEQLGFPHRRYGSDLAFWLPEPMELKEVIAHFDGIPLDALSRQPVRLEYIYLELMQSGRAMASCAA
jgi:ABC-2 type transport system ATP-binding protein